MDGSGAGVGGALEPVLVALDYGEPGLASMCIGGGQAVSSIGRSLA